ncbi:DUF3549 domain-containing protein [Marinomonas piezotolerans]|uniref:DUF3549 domain-containing protein n=1 Tax=Marinomonas piezotolerans TaxID=2213058 RepID=A0A370U5U2_9GAMM|nr:DUF3549 family protein [Marinomonas piezotolerans]RDL43146.1 DUF3549 domain-containing protein [Marinomonas piezotolerans]
MQNIESLSDLFEAVGCKPYFYDVGRRITKITPQQVIQFDRKQQPYPYGFRQHAWLACVLTHNDTSSEPVVWFLRLPLDETGCLNLGTRDHFIKTIVDKIMHKGEAQGFNEALEDNPYAFQPDQERLANFHSILARDLKRPASSYYNDVVTYLKQGNLLDAQQWGILGYQGITDFAARYREESQQDLLVKSLKCAPNEVRYPLSHALEHTVHDLTLVSLISDLLAEPHTSAHDAAHLVRAISRHDFPAPLFIPLFTLLGDITHCNDEQLELIASLVAKCPHWIKEQPQLLRIILEKLAHREDGLLGFKQIATDLTQQSSTRQLCWEQLRSPHASAALQQATGSLFNKGSNTLQ